jgi:MFS family permease
MLIVRIRPSVYLPCIMTVWGVLTCCMAAIKDYKHLVVLRIFVGVFEAGFAPAMLLLMSSWYKREEQSKRFGIYISAAILSGAFGGLLAGAITGGLDGAAGYEGWRWLFIVEGAATVLVAMLSYFILVDFPATTARFSERERAIAVARLQQGGVTARAEGAERMSKVQSFVLAIKDWRTIGFICGYMVSPLSVPMHHSHS